MALKRLHTLAQNKPFDYKYVEGGEIIVYPSDDDRNPQSRYGLLITHFEQGLVRDYIRTAGTVVIGASRDNPPPGSLGAILREHQSVPQILSYLSAILVDESFCTPVCVGNRLALSFNAVTA